MGLLEILTIDDVVVPLVSQDKNGAIRELINLLKKSGKITDIDKVYDAVMMREDKVSTGLEKGIAVPHGKTTAVNRVAVVIGVSPDGIEFGSFDGYPSKLIFLVIAHPDQSGAHIRLLSEIARLSQYQSLCDELIEAKSSENIISILHGE
jgi:nitrogen PTS system EIIA component